MSKAALSPAAHASLAIWHDMVAAGDLSRLSEIAREDAVFRSPMAHRPYPGRDALALALQTVSGVFENFRYHREFVSADGRSVVLEFSASVNGRELKGADFILFDAAGKIAEFEVMVRPMSGLAALGEEMGKRVGAALKGFM